MLRPAAETFLSFSRKFNVFRNWSGPCEKINIKPVKPVELPQTTSRHLGINFLHTSYPFLCKDKPCSESSGNSSSRYVVAKSCCRSIFETWKPKVPDLSCNNTTIKQYAMRPYEKKHCHAGMKCPEQTRCELEAKAKECQKVNHPKWLQHCPPRPKNKIDGPLPVLRAAMVQCKESKGKIKQKPKTKSLRKKCKSQIPKADWNIDGYLA